MNIKGFSFEKFKKMCPKVIFWYVVICCLCIYIFYDLKTKLVLNGYDYDTAYRMSSTFLIVAAVIASILFFATIAIMRNTTKVYFYGVVTRGLTCAHINMLLHSASFAYVTPVGIDFESEGGLLSLDFDEYGVKVERINGIDKPVFVAEDCVIDKVFLPDDNYLWEDYEVKKWSKIWGHKGKCVVLRKKAA